MAPPNIKGMISIKLKPRKDPYSDQFSRIVMVKMMMLTAAITAISWAKDKFNCINPKILEAPGGFISKACWINGIYIYENLPRDAQGWYYGIPKDISSDGVYPDGSVCDSNSPGVKDCKPMDKTFFLQYQWFPFAVAALAILFYVPYYLFCVVNADILGLKELVKKKKVDEVNYQEIIDTYFKRKYNSTSMLNSRILLNVIVKICYVVVNVVAMLVIDIGLNGRFLKYGTQWSKWLDLPSTDRHDYTKLSREGKPGHQLLPGFGLCQVKSSSMEKRLEYSNEYVFICELSQHVLYQYILIILWYMIVFGIIFSIIGLFKHLISAMSSAFCLGIEGQVTRKVYPNLAYRERQYMEFVRRKNLPVFGELLNLLAKEKGMRRSFESDSSGEAPYFNKKQQMEE